MFSSSKLKTVVTGLFKKSLKFFRILFSLNDEKGLNLNICEIVKILENNS